MPVDDRKYWIEMLSRVVKPVLDALSERKLKQLMPIEKKAEYERLRFTHLEALGRTLAGLAPWLETQTNDAEEESLRREFAEKARKAIDAGTDPESPDYMNFTYEKGPINDGAFLCHAILRAKTELWEKLDDRVKKNVITAMKQTRSRKPGWNNKILFQAMIEAALKFMGEEDWDPVRVDYALRQHEQWYVGDGMYGDGPDFHWDYYNSYVIQPLFVDLLSEVGDWSEDWVQMRDKVMKRAQRYAVIQERLISHDGTFPAIGRSLSYRCGAFQHLAQMALQHSLPEVLHPAQVRCALTAVIRRSLGAANTFDENGWLRIGFAGHQPCVGDHYISTGSLYLCSTVFLPLGLPPEDSFWQGKDMEWTSQLVWSGKEFPADRALKL